MVLKDEKKRLCGYLRVHNDTVVCRAKIDGPSQIVLFFEDGTQQSLEITGAAEQQLPCLDKRIAGCCVICGGAVLASDDAAREACVMSMARSMKTTERHEIHGAHEQMTTHNSETSLQTVPEQAEKNDRCESNEGQDGHLQGQRRWPPPPCWERACYRMGRWQERDEQTT